MVRPKERYRHGARRRGSTAQLEPCFVLERYRSLAALSGALEFHYGRSGLRHSVNALSEAVAPLPAMSTSDPGVVQYTIDRFLAENSGVADRITIESSSYSYGFTRYTTVFYVHQLNDWTYAVVRRNHELQHRADLLFGLQGSFGQGLIAVFPVTRSFSNYAEDLVTVAFNPETGQSSNTAAVRSLSSLAVSYPAGAIATPSINQSQAEAVHQSLPSDHPFKSLGASFWDDPLLGLNGLRGYRDDGDNPLRLIRRSNVLQLSEFSVSGNPQNVALDWTSSFGSNYSSQALEDRQEILLVDGLSSEDRSQVLTTAAVPSQLAAGTVNGGTESEYRYLAESTLIQALSGGVGAPLIPSSGTFLGYNLAEAASGQNLYHTRYRIVE